MPPPLPWQAKSPHRRRSREGGGGRRDGELSDRCRLLRRPIFLSPQEKPIRNKKNKSSLRKAASSSAAEREPSLPPPGAVWPRRSQSGNVMLEGYLEATTGADAGDQGSDAGGESVGRTKSLTDDDLEELKGCLDLGFGFSYDEIPELCGTLPALELCYSMSQRFLDEQQQGRAVVDVDGDETSPPASAAAAPSPPIANWRISSPADEGVLALWKGAGPTVVRAMGLNMGMLASYDQSVEFLGDSCGLGEVSTAFAKAQ